MRKSLVIVGFILFIVGVVLGFYASQRNCLIGFITRGYMSFWTAMEILRGDYSVSWHHSRIDWFDQENVKFWAKNTFPSTNNVLKRLSSLGSGLLYDFNCGETCWTV